MKYTKFYSENTVKLLMEQYKKDVLKKISEGCPLWVEMQQMKQPKLPKGEILVKENTTSFWIALFAGVDTFMKQYLG